MTWSPRSAIDVRAIGVDDWPLWRDLRLEALAEAPSAFRSTLAQWQGEGDTEVRWRARLSDVPANFVAYLDGSAAGMIGGTAADRDGTIELISMWVAPFARGRGVGDSLIVAVIDWAQKQRAKKITLTVFERNAHAAALYRRHQFVDDGDLHDAGSIFSRRHMVLDLPK